MAEEERKYAYFLCSTYTIGGVRAERLLARFGSPRAVYEAEAEEWRECVGNSAAEALERQKKSGEWEQEYGQLSEQQIHFLLREEKGFPGKLAEIPDPPYGIFYRGKLRMRTNRRWRSSVPESVRNTADMWPRNWDSIWEEREYRSSAEWPGGIDGISQQAALSAGGTSYGVLGCGVDICYPAQNRRLYEELLEKGGLLSTYAPGTKPLPQHFPPRNRIVSGLSDALIVIEARQKSGTLITVDMALEQGRDVYVVPGRLTDRLSDGCNHLLTQGAGVFLSPESFAEDFLRSWEEKQGLSADGSGGKNRRKNNRETGRNTAKVKLPKNPCKRSWNVWNLCQRHRRRCCRNFGRKGEYTDISALNRALMELELLGYARQNSPGHFSTSAN